jgi:glycosyltransferase involved in cell wall biosynthesis
MENPNEQKRRLISIILPAFNEEDNIPLCYDEITRVMAGTDCDYEVLVIDNDSFDATGERCQEICGKDPRWRYIKFSRNFTAEHSMAAGLRYSKGDAVVTMWSDLQDPPDLIREFIEKWKEGYSIVYGVYTAWQGASWARKTLGNLYYWLVDSLSDLSLPGRSADFRLMDRQVVNALNRLQERNRYMRGLAHWVGFRKYAIQYERRPRKFGESKMPIRQLLPYALQSICNFSVRPLRLFMALGLLVMVVAVLAALGYFVVYLTYGTRAHGILTVVLLLLANMGLTLFAIGVLGEYIGHIYTEAKERPLWIVEKAINIDIPDEHRYG